MAKYSARLSQLETKLIKPNPIHIVMKSYSNQSDSEAFDIYQAKRTAEGYTPQEGWDQVRAEFLCKDNNVDHIMFITFDVLGSVAPHPPRITNAKKNHEMIVI
jgi:hypothetical protein